MKTIHEAADTIMTYVLAGLAMLTNVNWMTVGGIVLLICRLIQDVPPAYNKLKEILSKNGDNKPTP